MSNHFFDTDTALSPDNPEVEEGTPAGPALASVSEIDDADAIRTALVDRVRDVCARTNGAERIVRVSVPLPASVHPLDWLRAQPVQEALYWSGRGEDTTVAGAGAADRVVMDALPMHYPALHDALTARLGTAEAPVRYFGGVRFDAGQPAATGRPDQRWAPFSTARFVLPRLTLHRTESDARLTCTLVLPRDLEAADAIAALIGRTPLPKDLDLGALPSPVSRTDVPAEAEWIEMVKWALRAFDADRLDKVVLARRVALAFRDRLDALGVLQHLEAATPGCFHFAVRPDGPSTFIGASPERLFRHRGGTVATEAVAGTRSRGDSDEADAALRDELLESEKDRREHAYVEDAIRSRLDALCETVEVDEETTELELTRGRHLRSHLRGTLQADVTSVDLLAALHPTPAVGGVPRRRALAAIRKQEPFDRGWYAGPVGWIGRNAAEFAVAIRSGLVRGDGLDLFSGAGIVDGSVPTDEWDEIEQKLGDFAAVLGIRD